MLIRIEAPHFVAGIVYENEVIIRIAPIIKYMDTWFISNVISYCNKKGYKYQIFDQGQEVQEIGLRTCGNADEGVAYNNIT